MSVSCLRLVRTLPTRLFVLLSVMALVSCGGGGGSSNNSGTNTGTTVSTDATLSALNISGGGSLSPAFSATTTNYSDSVDYAITSVTVKATTTDSHATVKVNGTSVASGSNSNAINLAQGSNSITVVVTAQDGSTTKTYSIDVTRLPSAYLSNLNLTNASLDQIFQDTQLSYTSSVNFLVNAIGETATLQDSKASMTIDGNSATSGTKMYPVYLATGTHNVDTVVTASDGTTKKTYSIAVTRNTTLAQQEYTASDASTNDDFGVSIAISGNTMVIGADQKSTSSYSFNGAAYVYAYDTNLGKWVYQTTLTASSPASGDHFGQSVAIDGNTIVVGAPQRDPGAVFNAGAVYVFTGSGASWTQQAKLTASNAGFQDQFGTSVSVSGNTIVVGAPFHSGGGAAYVFVNNGSSGSGWAAATETILPATNLGSSDLFGKSVSISGNTIVVGAPSHVVNSYATGAAYVFTGSGTSWTEQPILSVTNGAAGDEFGQTVAISGNTIAVGATGQNSNAGAAYVFTKGSSGWAQQGGALQASNAEANDAFGYSIALSGERLVVGADQEDGNASSDGTPTGSNNSATDSGAVYVFMRNQTNNTISWSQTAYLKASDAANSDYFGSSVGIDNDKLVTGARNKAVTTNTGAGGVYAFQ